MYGNLPVPITFQKMQILFRFGKMSQRFGILKSANILGALEPALIEQRVVWLSNSKIPWNLFPTD